MTVFEEQPDTDRCPVVPMNAEVFHKSPTLASRLRPFVLQMQLDHSQLSEGLQENHRMHPELPVVRFVPAAKQYVRTSQADPQNLHLSSGP